MRQLNGIYTQAFNKRHKRAGHIFQGRYKAILKQKEDFVEGLIDYVKGYRDIKEIPSGYRYANRPGLDRLFDEGIKGDRKICNK